MAKTTQERRTKRMNQKRALQETTLRFLRSLMAGLGTYRRARKFRELRRGVHPCDWGLFFCICPLGTLRSEGRKVGEMGEMGERKKKRESVNGEWLERVGSRF